MSVTEPALVIVPTYNEVDTIEEVAQRLFAACGSAVSLLVIDDGSPDGTAEVVRNMSEAGRSIHLIERAGKQGLGTAYVAGFRWAIERGFTAVVEMDADLSHDPADVPRLLAAIESADLAIGSRYVPGGRTENWSRTRRWLSLAGNIYARTWLGFRVMDSTSGFRAYRVSALGAEDLDSVGSSGYAFQIEMARRVHLDGGTIAEVPITFVERVQGRSKMSRRIVLEAIVKVTRWGVHDRFTRSR